MQPSLLDLRPTFDGSTFSEPEDGSRLRKQLARVQAHMLAADWQSLAEIEAATGYPQASISARLRDLRKPKMGGYLVERRRRSAGTYEYRVRSAA